MPRATDYLVEGYTYHLTHRCIEKRFFLKSRKDRNTYRKWLYEAVKEYKVPVHAYCITRNHVHIVAHAVNREAIANMMRLASGSVAKRYNINHERIGSVWEHPYHCTMIQNGRHLCNCLSYVHLNMVRAGEVKHPDDWVWCGHDELTGKRQRYCILDVDNLAEKMDVMTVDQVREWYKASIESRLTRNEKEREPHWTEALAVGNRDFIDKASTLYRHRRRFESTSLAEGVWAVKEEAAPYGCNNYCFSDC